MEAIASVPIDSTTPVLIVQQIDPCLPFWSKFGFSVIAQVPHHDMIGFAMLSDGKQMLMLQTFESANADVVLAPAPGGAVVYLSVQDLSAVEAVLEPASIVLPRRVTNYGATEVWVREPGGNLVGFAQHQRE